MKIFYLLIFVEILHFENFKNVLNFNECFLRVYAG